MPRLSEHSIALITYATDFGRDDDSPPKYATGFFTETLEYKKVCVTCAHVLHDHPGPDREILYLNGLPARSLFDASREFGVDVAILEVPKPLLEHPEIYFHKLGKSSAVNRVYYSHGWDLLEGYRDAVQLVKIWGPRLKRKPVQHLPPLPVLHSVWELRNDVFDPQSGLAFSSTNFVPGWSGAPVFNVRPRGEEDRVIGVLSVVAGEGARATAVSIEKLDFLRPAEEQAREGRVGRAKPTPWERLAAKLGRAPLAAQPEYEIRFDDEPEPKLFHKRFTEITRREVCPPVPEPPSPYDVTT